MGPYSGAFLYPKMLRPQLRNGVNRMLSDLACRNAKPGLKDYKLYDSDGLYLLITPKGKKYWRFKYHILGKEKKLSLGAYPSLSLSDARQKRDENKQLLAGGKDPSEAKHEEKQLAIFNSNQTFENVAREWHKHYYNTWSPQHADAILYRIEKELLPRLGKIQVSKLTPPMVVACIQEIENRGAHETARRALQNCGQVMRYAVATGRAHHDVTRDLRGTLKRYKKGHYATIEINELPKLIAALDNNKARLYEQTVNATKLLLLTFVRTSELIMAEWSEFDLDKAEWIIPAHRMKMRDSHFVPLSQQVVAILRRQQEISGKRKYVFPSIAKPDKTMSNATILGALKRIGYQKKMTGHGFRALAMSTLKEKLGYRHEVVDRQLAHLPRNKVDQAYDRAKFIPERIKMMQVWADYIDGQDKTRTASSNVVPIRTT